MTDYTQQFFENNPFYKPMAETDYFNWLKDKDYTNFNVIETKRLYLKERFGFEVGVDRVGEKAIRSMRYIESFYYDFWVLKKFQ